MSKKPLQIVTAILALVPVLTGIATMLGIHDPLYACAGLPTVPVLDSNLRFFGGVWLGLGLSVFLASAHDRAAKRTFTVLEIVGAPLFVWWQARVAAASVRAPPEA